ncbi:MAG: 30S ribosomal protein S20 [Rhodothermaceae bacterium]|nr:30S ribosomal protein S20 [Rhodothermaceae bacterium]
MPQHKSAAKRVRQTERRRVRNKKHTSKMRTLVKRLEVEEDKEKALSLLSEVKASLDKLAARRIIHRNKAANYKSTLEKKVNQLS